jgi:hypothetical protein
MNRKEVAAKVEEQDQKIRELRMEVAALKALHHPSLAGDSTMEVVIDDAGTVEKVSTIDPWRQMLLREFRILRGALEVQDELIRRLIKEVKGD